MSPVLECAPAGRVLRVTLNRPERRNALSAGLCHELAERLEAADGDPDVGAILLTGKGRSFCAGMDVDEIATSAPSQINAAQERLFTIGSRLTIPLIAAVRGAALGGGLGLVANCHIVIAGEDASFGFTEIRLGLWPFLVFRPVEAAVGERRTLEMAVTGRIFGAAEARETGLVHEVSPDPEARAREVAELVASYSPTAMRKGMAFVRDARGMNWETAGRMAGEIRHQIFASPDLHEGIRAFREKRPPKWPSLGS